MSEPALYIVDAFTDVAFRGNPAAVCMLDGPRDDAWMQSSAAEMNLSETAFLSPEGADWSLRWFTPTIEVDLCGHATLASAHVLWQIGLADRRSPIHFQTRSGLLATKWSDGWIVMDFPSDPPVAADAPIALIESLGVAATFIGRGKFDYLVELENAEAVRRLTPRMDYLAQVETRGVTVTAAGDEDRFDFVSRFFAPRAGIDEDPVTGSAHCMLAPYWSAKLGRTELVGWQASRRGGLVKTIVADRRVALRGQAVTVLRGTFLT